jgi:hypothetical protein
LIGSWRCPPPRRGTPVDQAQNITPFRRDDGKYMTKDAYLRRDPFGQQTV